MQDIRHNLFNRIQREHGCCGFVLSSGRSFVLSRCNHRCWSEIGDCGGTFFWIARSLLDPHALFPSVPRSSRHQRCAELASLTTSDRTDTPSVPAGLTINWTVFVKADLGLQEISADRKVVKVFAFTNTTGSTAWAPAVIWIVAWKCYLYLIYWT